MSSSGTKWAELSSQHERLAQPAERELDSAKTSLDARSQWAELASQSERLVDRSDPLVGLASSSRSTLGMRRVASAA
ncbi:MAG TPA: hypothetical protein VEV61_04190 [Streptosporangiaceae bacterium]|nr:hypothetical protein [Streptosporangiaceae bacterium]